ncbi:MAG TPA: hypothetical protein DF383_11135 [Deltaproteobacteria bacterium]|nr:hypothetical protein [Deltaproteobacteria bacterium]
MLFTMSMSLIVQEGYRISLKNAEFQEYSTETYDAFLDLARSLSRSFVFAADLENVVLLQELFFLLEKGVVNIRRDEAKDGEASLFLSVQY